jgi:FkbM family methyltransferase
MSALQGTCCERHRLSWCASANLSREVLQRVVCNSTVVRTSRQCHACLDGTPLTFHVSGLDLASKIWGELRTGAWSGTQEVRKLNTSAQDIATIVDVGGNLGIFAAIGYRLLRKQGFRCVRILTIEPLPESYLVLKWNLWQNGVLESPPGTLNADDVAGAGGVQTGTRGRPWCGVRALNLALTSGARTARIVVGTRSMTAHEASTRSGRRPDGSFQLEWDAIGGAGDPALISSRAKAKAKAAATAAAAAGAATAATAAGLTRGLNPVGASSSVPGPLAAAGDASAARVPTAASSDGYRHYEVPGMTFKELLRSHDITRVDLLKLDCEGCEYELLKELRASPGFASQLQHRVKRVAGELHLCNKMYSLRDRTRCEEARAYFQRLWPEVPLQIS